MLDTIIQGKRGLWVEYSRTYSHIKYSPEKMTIGFNVPDDVSLPNAQDLAEAIVNLRLGVDCVVDYKRLSPICEKIFGEPLTSFQRKKRGLVSLEPEDEEGNYTGRDTLPQRSRKAYRY